MLALTAHSAASGNAVVERIKKLYPAMKFDMKVPDTTVQALGKGFVIDIEGVAIAVAFVPAPLPTSVVKELVERERIWKEAEQALVRHSAHAVIAPVNSVSDHASALNAAAYVTFVAGAIASLLKTEAVVWMPAGTLSNAAAFRAAAAELARKRLPVMSWVRFDAAKHNPPVGPQRFAATVRTEGLLPFVGRELFCGSSAQPLKNIALGIIEIAESLLARGPFIKSGDTMTITGVGNAVARCDRSNDVRGIDVLVIDIDGAAAIGAGAPRT
jgi:hypothetical protein